ncbi:ABC transporter ATP-binding protein [Testudinibacter sp. TR-2022]|uniref:ABC transporter ATP-binding protein n=1 Tax=Testudinibacter sp. TR-2022 TaxID=2585029 RepID=UPI001119794B|nr:ABC transporter ATP-binding protein [Testudinibacter sp. TR-2022]TNH00306.1 ABC transporter ATP-binding protein [Pasteurellaceae bacterium Phil31]TNH09726.1 ABC transporter ATP-binding protein [Testudinibacter sp. TR-2022]TNH11107.1 ABC transporter ATP-binding protein [Testudinibacter sp. TR-2022]TNH13399.1 ABC transporter ATP-binding protein [Testudinibacter sp. TR-2022]TNH19495.1 ABC transporter ATP-binding protein [Testudinibacter sp. TR-2022]
MLHIENMSVCRGVGNNAFTVSLPHLSLNSGEVVAICGTSGCGKSTLLEMIGLILKPTRLTRYQLGAEQDISPLILQQNQTALATLRATSLGFMLQTGGLLPFLTVKRNICLPNNILNNNTLNDKADSDWISHLVQQLNLSHLLESYPNRLSIGERQRVAFIRAVAHKPKLLLADEPTSALDPEHANILFDLMLNLVQEQNIAALVVTHDRALINARKLPYLQADLTSAGCAVFGKQSGGAV